MTGPYACPECGSEQLSWRVSRMATGFLRHSSREIRWLCRTCDHEWTDPIVNEPDPLPVPGSW